MAITINIYYQGRGGSAKDFALEMLSSGIVSEIHRKKGNLRYEYFLPVKGDDAVLLIDKWEDQEALDEHHRSNTMKKIMSLREKYDLTMTVERFVDDVKGIPQSDRKFIAEK